jgi:hypothetical protein
MGHASMHDASDMSSSCMHACLLERACARLGPYRGLGADLSDGDTMDMQQHVRMVQVMLA